MKKLAVILLACLCFAANANDRVQCINNDWKFALGNAADALKDFNHNTEYFTHIAKARANSEGKSPTWPAFDDSAWQTVSLPHDWVVDLPFSGEASHSHGYKCIGWKYPQNSVGWYRKSVAIPAEWKGRRVQIYFEGIFRNSEVFCNGFYMGGRSDGYLQQVYDLTDYLDYGEDNVIAVRVDASVEEGWFYEGAGIYRNVWLYNTPMNGIAPLGVRTFQEYDAATGRYSLDIVADTMGPVEQMTNELIDSQGNVLASGTCRMEGIEASEWSCGNPVLYTLRTVADADTVLTRIGFRRAEFIPGQGFLLNGEKFILKGCDLHQDHAGVGSGIPTALMRYRLNQLRKYGFNAIRSSHNPASPAFLDLCDEMGFLVIDENREIGTNARQLGNLEDMIKRDLNHPCVVLWSVANEEWALEWTPKGETIARKMCERAHIVDPTRLCTYGSSGGRELVKGVDVFGYNYIVQNPVEEYHVSYPSHVAVGTEETTGAGTRGEYATVPENGWMQPINRTDKPGCLNVIERGWQFYHNNAWTGGLFYWTGIDYRGEPNPMSWPATGSQFGILDYCGYPKDEAFYLQSWWLTSEPVIHVCGKSDGEVWVYSNCSAVELFDGRKSLGSKTMPTDGHLAWKVTSDGPFTARGKFGKLRVKDTWPCALPGEGDVRGYEISADCLLADGQDVVVVDVLSEVPSLSVSVSGACLLGWGNGDPGFKETERPQDGSNSLVVKPFNGRAQILVRSVCGARGKAVVQIGETVIEIPVI